MPTSDGRIDMVLKTKRSIYVLELKYKKDAETAMEQIERKDYAATFADNKRKKNKEKILSQNAHQPKNARTTAVMQAHIR